MIVSITLDISTHESEVRSLLCYNSKNQNIGFMSIFIRLLFFCLFVCALTCVITLMFIISGT